MCGLVGVAGNLYLKDINAFKELLIVNQIRGFDSTGIGVVNKQGDMLAYKLAIAPAELLQFKNVDARLNSNAKVLMGHNRAATRGKVNTVNAHPFIVGDTMGAHNGTLEWGCLNGVNRLAPNLVGDTDSERLVHEIDNTTIHEAIAKAEGAWALTIYDKNTETINLVRNDKRPLFYAKSKDGDTMWWASEAYMLRWILDRNNIDFENKVYQLPVDVIFTWTVPNDKEVFAARPTRREAKGKSVQNFPVVHQHHRPPAGGTPVGVTKPGHNFRDPAGSATNAGSDSSVPTTAATGQVIKPTPLTKPGFKSFRRPDAVYTQLEIAALVNESIHGAQWDIYGLAYDDFDDGVYHNPFNPVTHYEHWDQYEDKWKEAQKHAEKKAPSKVILVGDLAPKKTEVEEPKAPFSNLVEKMNAMDEAKKGNVTQLRMGPEGKQISPAKFREITKHVCGWCDKKIKANDGGRFCKVEGFDPNFYVGECCVDDPNLAKEVA
jgi:predicted glutamine amidotransferase